jgi:tetratricopeptide (TPR) repeat protein
MYQKALELIKNNFGEDHIEYATNLGGLAGVLRNFGDYQGSKECYQKVLKIKKNIYGENHIQFAATLGELAGVLESLGEY